MRWRVVTLCAVTALWTSAALAQDPPEQEPPMPAAPAGDPAPPAPAPSSPGSAPPSPGPPTQPAPVQPPPAQPAPVQPPPAQPPPGSAAQGGYAPTGYYQPGQPPQQPPYGQPPPGAYPYPAQYDQRRPPPPPPPPTGQYEHDGFFMRLGLGFGVFRDSVETDSGVNVGSDMMLSGGLLAIDIMFGGTPADGLVIGGALAAGPIPEPKTEIDGDRVDLDNDVERAFSILGVLFQWYPDPKTGLHLQGILGLASVDESNHSDSDDDFQAGGGAIAVGGGYEWFVGTQWSLGLTARIAAASLVRNDDVAEETHSVIAPSLLFGATFH